MFLFPLGNTPELTTVNLAIAILKHKYLLLFEKLYAFAEKIAFNWGQNEDFLTEQEIIVKKSWLLILKMLSVK